MELQCHKRGCSNAGKLPNSCASLFLPLLCFGCNGALCETTPKQGWKGWAFLMGGVSNVFRLCHLSRPPRPPFISTFECALFLLLSLGVSVEAVPVSEFYLWFWGCHLTAIVVEAWGSSFSCSCLFCFSVGLLFMWVSVLLPVVCFLLWFDNFSNNCLF